MVSTTVKGGFTTHKLEGGDVFSPSYDKVMRKTLTRKADGQTFEKRSLKATIVSDSNNSTLDGQEVYVSVTELQADRIDEVGGAEGKVFACEGYTSKAGNPCVGVKVKKGDDSPSPSPSLSLGSEPEKKTLKGSEFLPQVKEWKESKVPKERVIETLVQKVQLKQHEAEALYEAA